MEPTLNIDFTGLRPSTQFFSHFPSFNIVLILYVGRAFSSWLLKLAPSPPLAPAFLLPWPSSHTTENTEKDEALTAGPAGSTETTTGATTHAESLMKLAPPHRVTGIILPVSKLHPPATTSLESHVRVLTY